MMRLATCVILSVVLWSCQHVERPVKPDDLISKEKMVLIMTDVYLGNAARSVNNKVIRQNALKLDSMIYSKYGIDSMQFVRSNTYYTSRLDDYAEIFTGVEERLTNYKQTYDSLIIPPATNGRPASKTDSVRDDKKLIEPARSN